MRPKTYPMPPFFRYFDDIVRQFLLRAISEVKTKTSQRCTPGKSIFSLTVGRFLGNISVCHNVSLSCRGWASGHPGPKWQGFLPQSLQTLAQHGYAGYGTPKLRFSRRICTAEALGIAGCVSEKGTSASQVTSHFQSDDENHWRSPLHWKFAFRAWDFSRSWTTLRCTSRSALKWDQAPTRPYNKQIIWSKFGSWNATMTESTIQDTLWIKKHEHWTRLNLLKSQSVQACQFCPDNCDATTVHNEAKPWQRDENGNRDTCFIDVSLTMHPLLCPSDCTALKICHILAVKVQRGMHHISSCNKRYTLIDDDANVPLYIGNYTRAESPKRER